MSATTLNVLRVGSCRHLECLAARGGRWALRHFPALVGLIRHEQHGWILYDTGYAGHYFAATERWPERLYRLAMPVELPQAERLEAQLAVRCIAPCDIGLVIVSHYHGDHIAGLRDFPRARFLALRADTERLLALRGRRTLATLKAQLHGLLPPDYFERLRHAEELPRRPLPKWLAPFAEGFDLLGDGSVLGVPLPGHSAGQLGVFLPDNGGRPVFLVADACWSLPDCIEGRLPSRLAGLVNDDNPRYRATFFGLTQLARREQAVALVPSHCTVAWQAFGHGA